MDPKTLEFARSIDPRDDWAFEYAFLQRLIETHGTVGTVRKTYFPTVRKYDCSIGEYRDERMVMGRHHFIADGFEIGHSSPMLLKYGGWGSGIAPKGCPRVWAACFKEGLSAPVPLSDCYYPFVLDALRHDGVLLDITTPSKV